MPEKRDGTGYGDHDHEYRFGNAAQAVACMPLFDQGRLLAMRGRIQDYRAGIPGGPADGELGYTIDRASGISVPLTDPSTFGEKK